MRKIAMRGAINEALHIALSSDDTILTFGEDIATYGGQLRCSYDLMDHFGEKRIFDTPISENAIVGMGIGASMLGLRPIIELSYIDFIGVCFDQIINQMAKLRYMYGGTVSLPLVVRTQGGAGLGNGAQHSQSLEGILAQIPGIKVVMPSNPYDAKGLLLRAIRDNSPVFFIEHKALYKIKGEVPEEPYECDFCCNVVREGKDISIITYSAMVNQAVKSAEKLAEEGIDAEIIDLRSIRPFDKDTVIRSVKKTGNALIVQEANLVGGFAAEVAAVIQEECLAQLKRPVRRIGSPNVPVPFAPVLERTYLPNADDITDVVMSMLR